MTDISKQIKLLCDCIQIDPDSLLIFDYGDKEVEIVYHVEDADDEHYIDEFKIECKGFIRKVKLKNIVLKG